MNKKILLKNLLAASTLSLLLSGTAFAASGTLTVNGTITATACTLDSASYTVNLDTIPASTLDAANKQAGYKPQDIKVSCPEAQGTYPKVALEFSSQNFDSTTGQLLNTEPTGAATNVQIRLADGTVTNFLDMKSGSATTAAKDGAAVVTFPILLGYSSTAAVTPGKVLANATVSIVLP